jgi:hypothetical protein
MEFRLASNATYRGLTTLCHAQIKELKSERKERGEKRGEKE